MKLDATSCCHNVRQLESHDIRRQFLEYTLLVLQVERPLSSMVTEQIPQNSDSSVHGGLDNASAIYIVLVYIQYLGHILVAVRPILLVVYLEIKVYQPTQWLMICKYADFTPFNVSWKLLNTRLLGLLAPL